MIETRGKEKTLVVANSAVPVFDVCESITRLTDVEELQTKFPISEEEIFECVETFLSLPQHAIDDARDAIEFTYDSESKNFNFKSITDVLYFNLVLFGRIYEPKEKNFVRLTVVGLKNVLLECLTDMSKGNMSFKEIPMHNLIFNYLLSTSGEEINFTDLLHALQGELIIRNKLDIEKTK